MQANSARLAFGQRQPLASILFSSRERRFFVARVAQRRDPGIARESGEYRSTGSTIMGSVFARIILIGGLVCAAGTAHAQQQRGAAPRVPIAGAAIAVAPPLDGQPAAWVTNGGLVLYCIRQPPADPNDPKQNPAGRVRCSGAFIGQPQGGSQPQGGVPTSLTPIGDAAQNSR